jgi:precorrin-8X/cobalt-precorrin-8 methylmutase
MNSATGGPIGGLVDRYVIPPDEIERRSLASVQAALNGRFEGADEQQVAARIIYAAGDLDLAGRLQFSVGAVAAGVAALRNGAPIVTDVRMVLSGINTGAAEAAGCQLYCAIDDAGVVARARASNRPRAVEAIRALAPRLDGAVVAIGNAPTALLSLLDLIDAGRVQPALVIGMPVGFVLAAEAKQELAARTVPHLTLSGPRGGSPLAAAAVNALLKLAGSSGQETDRARTAVLFAGHGSRALDAAEAMVAAVDRVQQQGKFPVVEIGYLEMTQPDIPAALQKCVEQGATRILVVPYFLHQGMHIRRDIPLLLREEAVRYPGVSVSMGRPIGLNADLANVMITGALETEALPDIRDVPLENLPPRGSPLDVAADDE